MILSLEIHNFLSHPNTLLKFVPNTNVFIGHSDSGKSAIRDALEWIAWNRPLGDSFVSWDHVREGKGTFVKLVMDDCIVIRSKDKIDTYTIQIEGKKDLVLEAFGKDVPKEVEQVINFSNINIQKQLDPIFLLSSTPGQVAEHWNVVAHLQVIDQATSNINSVISELNSTIGREAIKDKPATGLIKQIADAEEKLLQFSYLPTFELEVVVLEDLEKQKSVLVEQRNKLDVNISRLTDINEDLEEVSRILVIEKPVNDILELIELRAEKELEAEKLNRLIVQVEEIQSNIEKQNALLIIEKPVNDLLKLYKEKETLVEQRSNLNKAITNLSDTQVNLNKAKVNYGALHLQFEKNMGSVCILCGQTIKN